MIELKSRRILIDGKPGLIFAGEVHYFRLDVADWPDRLSKLKELGCNAVASYIPWIVHEEKEGQIDLTGRLVPNNDLTSFIDLCQKNGLYFIARPGPFVMAEMKNEGIPDWVHVKWPDAVPVSWKGEKAHSHSLDYLNAGFLQGVKRWYAAVMPILADRLQPKGGSVIAVQLDNEVGMLNWVTNQPDLSEDTLCDFSAWLTTKYHHDQLHARYPFDLNDPVPRTKAIRDPAPAFQAALHRDYGDYERARAAKYFKTLRGYAEASGVRDVPFIVNIHGSGGGRATAFPIGIHQLYEAYTQDAGYLAGSDHYLGDLTRENVQDLYFINAFMAAVNRPEQPLSATEFEVGSGDYGENGAVRYSPSAADFKVRLSIAQGNRLLNYYLLAGGRNRELIDPPHDGNGRIAITGERHGFAAPISPEGELDPTYFSLRETTRSMLAVADKLADMDEEHDGIALGFIPDYYKTDYRQPGPMSDIVSDLEIARGPLEKLSRSLLLQCLRFPAADIANRPLDPMVTRCLALSPARQMDASVQEKLVGYLRGGGKLLLFGDCPDRDMENRPCTVLADALGVRPSAIKQDSDRFYLSVKGTSWLDFEPEVRTWRVRTFGEPRGGVLMRVAQSNEPCAIEASVGKGRAIVVACDYPNHRRFFDAVLDRLGVKPALRHDCSEGGIVLTSVANAAKERFITALNLDQSAKQIQIVDAGTPLLGGHRLTLGAKEGRLMPVNVRFGSALVNFSTTELVHVGDNELRFRGTGVEEVASITSDRGVRAIGATAVRQGGTTVVRSKGGPFTISMR